MYRHATVRRCPQFKHRWATIVWDGRLKLIRINLNINRVDSRDIVNISRIDQSVRWYFLGKKNKSILLPTGQTKKKCCTANLFSSLIISPVKVVWTFEQRAIIHFIWEFILREGITSYELRNQEYCPFRGLCNTIKSAVTMFFGACFLFTGTYQMLLKLVRSQQSYLYYDVKKILSTLFFGKISCSRGMQGIEDITIWW